MSEDGGEERLLAFLRGSLARTDSASAWSSTDCSNEERLAVSRPLLEPVAAASGALEKKSLEGWRTGQLLDLLLSKTWSGTLVAPGNWRGMIGSSVMGARFSSRLAGRGETFGVAVAWLVRKELSRS